MLAATAKPKQTLSRRPDMSLRKGLPKGAHLLVAVDFSDCSRHALRKTAELLSDGQSHMTALHVVDQRFMRECVRRKLTELDEIKKKLFIEAKTQLKELLREEGLDGGRVKALVREGVPYQQIARHAEKLNVDMIVIGTCGMVGDTEAIFFGGTAEKVLRFISRPVLCVPPPSDE
jgi:nucleotide-binding universal stress UspA family protein